MAFFEIRALSVTSLSLALLVGCSAPNPQPDRATIDATVDQQSPDRASDDAALDAIPNSDALPDQSADGSDVALDQSSDSTSSDGALMCLPTSSNCEPTRDRCCAGLFCRPLGGAAQCTNRFDCPSIGSDCGDEMMCCPGLVCMVRGGAGGRACADPMCRNAGESCDEMHPCCPSSACAGAPGAQTCLPTP